MRSLIMLMSLMVLFLAATAHAEGVDTLLDRLSPDELLKQPSSPSGGPGPLWGMAISMFMVVAVLGVSLMPSKRGHQD